MGAFLAAMLSSCYSTQTFVGDYQKLTYNGSENFYEYYTGKQCYLLGGLIPLGKKMSENPPLTNCEICTKQRFVDMLVSGATFRIFSMQSVTVNAVRREDNKQR